MTGAHRSVVHDIPVAVVPERLWPDYQEPDMPDIDVSICAKSLPSPPPMGISLIHAHVYLLLTCCAILIHTLVGEYIPTSSEATEEHHRQNEDLE